MNEEKAHQMSSYHAPKSKWFQEEDNILIEQIRINGPSKWNKIAEQLPGRNGKQCRERWIGKLSPENAQSSWSSKEDVILMQCQRKIGNRWAKFAPFLPGRSVIAIKNRWNYLKRRSIPSQFLAIAQTNGIEDHTCNVHFPLILADQNYKIEEQEIVEDIDELEADMAIVNPCNQLAMDYANFPNEFDIMY